MQFSKLQGAEQLIAKLKKNLAIARQDPNPEVTVGYTAAYALYVHEYDPNRKSSRAKAPNKSESKAKAKGEKGQKKKHKPWDTGQPKFLEQPARELRPELMEIVKVSVANGATLRQALIMAGLRLQRESQKLCPVDTGNLKNSAFTRAS